jgi:hypothetical protein
LNPVTAELVELVGRVQYLGRTPQALTGTVEEPSEHHRDRTKEAEMIGIVVACLTVGTPLVALGLHDLQATAERWASERHAED